MIGPDEFDEMLDRQWQKGAAFGEKIAQAQIAQLQAERDELLYAVEEKVPGETRHQTALRLIKKAQECGGNNEKSIEGEGNG